jgi:hypothetical protein
MHALMRAAELEGAGVTADDNVAESHGRDASHRQAGGQNPSQSGTVGFDGPVHNAHAAASQGERRQWKTDQRRR